MPKEKKAKDLEDLPGVGPTTAEKLKAAGYDCFEKIATSSPHELEEVAGIAIETGKKAIAAARDSLEMGYESADMILERRKAIGRLTTGSKELDGLLGGGVETQAITEAFGKYSSGKTQLGFQLAVNAQKPAEQGGLGGAALFVDTESTFRPERIKQIAEAAGMDVEAVLKNIHVAKAVNSDHQMILVDKMEEIIKKIKNKVDAVICWDLSVIELCRKYKIEFHISTQASVANSSSARFSAIILLFFITVFSFSISLKMMLFQILSTCL